MVFECGKVFSHNYKELSIMMIKLRSPLDNFHAGFRLNGFRPNDILESRDGDTDAWRLEVERVAPSLKVIIKFPITPIYLSYF